jgi:hypothetical protein
MWHRASSPVNKENLMKKTPKKLTLSREIIVKLAVPDLGKVAGAIVSTDDLQCMQHPTIQRTTLDTW